MIIARELVQTVRQNVTIDWTVKENMRAIGAPRAPAIQLLARYAGEGDDYGVGASRSHCAGLDGVKYKQLFGVAVGVEFGVN